MTTNLLGKHVLVESSKGKVTATIVAVYDSWDAVNACHRVHFTIAQDGDGRIIDLDPTKNTLSLIP